MLIILAVGCQEKSKNVATEVDSKFNDLTSVFYKIEESNRIELKKIIEENYITSSDTIKFKIIELYEIIDIVTEELLIESGGYHQSKAYLIGGLNNQFNKSIIDKFQLKNSVINKFQEIKFFENDYLTKKVEQSLHPILNNVYFEEMQKSTMAQLYLELMVIQKRLLIDLLRPPYPTAARIDKSR